MIAPVSIETLSSALADEVMDELIELSSSQGGWTRENFLYELPGKWRLSFVARSQDGSIAALAMMSNRTPDTVHLHEFVVKPCLRGQGLGELLLGEAFQRSGDKPLTLKVAQDNTGAIRFYLRAGMIEGSREGDYLWLESNRS